MPLISHRAGLASLLLAAVGLLSLHVAAICPSNGNLHVIYCTTNVGDDIYAFDTDGHLLGNILNKHSIPANMTIDKLREMQLGPDGLLYTTSARGIYSAVIALKGNGLLNHSLNSDCTRNFSHVVTKIDARTNPHLDHPYGLTFYPKDGTMFVSNQNSVTITRYYGPHSDVVRKDSRMLGTPSPWSSAMIASGKNTSSSIRDVQVGVGGVFAAGWNQAARLDSVRGLALSPPLPPGLAEGVNLPGVFAIPERELVYYLLVCDVLANRIAVYDPDTGIQLWTIPVPGPIQVFFPSSSFERHAGGVFTHPEFYVTSKTDGAVYRGLLSKGREHVEAVTQRFTDGHAASGIVENPTHGTFLVADRYAKEIIAYGKPRAEVGASESKKDRDDRTAQYLGPFHVGLGAQPEYLVIMQLESQASLPPCSELSPSGSLREAAICRAVSLWKVLGLVAIIFVVMLYLRGHLLDMIYGGVSEKARRRRALMEEEEDDDAPSSAKLDPAVQTKRYGSA